MTVDAGTVVVGAGPIGASAARHLSLLPDAGPVIVIGPDAPADTHTHDGIHGAWHDEARLTRIIANDDVWAALAAASMARYADIEAESGIRFHQPGGVLYVHEGDRFVQQQRDVAARHGAVWEDLTHDPARVPWFRFHDGSALLLEGGDAGTVNPRALVAAQLAVAQQRGATLLRDTVTTVDPDGDGVTVRTEGGATVRARRVVVAAGAYVNAFGFFAPPLPVTAVGITALFFDVDDLADELTGMPGMLWYHDHPDAHFLYAVPPTRYPDGRRWFKIGGFRESGPLADRAAIDHWHRTDGGRMDAEQLRDWVSRHIPVLAGRDRHAVGCVITDTASARPLLTEVLPSRVIVATGCAGAAAKSCDEIGRLAAVLAVQGRWDSPLDQGLFQG